MAWDCRLTAALQEGLDRVRYVGGRSQTGGRAEVAKPLPQAWKALDEPLCSLLSGKIPGPPAGKDRTKDKGAEAAVPGWPEGFQAV